MKIKSLSSLPLFYRRLLDISPSLFPDKNTVLQCKNISPLVVNLIYFRLGSHVYIFLSFLCFSVFDLSIQNIFYLSWLSP